ncbi:DUF5677 domain-containing protein [Acidovorax sp. M14]|uniref:DUF5677 domain-containing protein n=1 Tax=Acidovorax sp. M14 TaxID=3411354 RepID=UPI003BF575CE
MASDPKTLEVNYREALDKFERLVLIAVSFSDSSGGIHTTTLGIESTKIYTRITLSAMSINALLPRNKINNTGLWDFPSVATLTRALIETCHRHLYLSQPGLSEDESAFRMDLYFYHMNSEKYRLYKEFGANQEILNSFEENLPRAKSKIIGSTTYSKLAKVKADKIKRGHSDMYLTDDEVAEHFSLIGGHFKPIYRLLSNHSHGSPFATYSQSNERGRGVENEAEKSYLILMLELLNQYLSRTTLAQVALLSIENTNPKGFEYAQEIFSAERA